MASLNLFLAPVFTTHRRVVVRTGATASKASGASSSSEEKGVFDFVLGVLAKEEQIYETDPILKKVEKKNLGGGTTGRSTPVVSPPEKKNGGFDFGGFFSKK
ncbi:uncharacterized protein [Henckelia pumila]|uniref:uncharacterized protein n=1 Tax=Henckelia pumila TaxID=405737 RepID=UPI003C6E0287